MIIRIVIGIRLKKREEGFGSVGQSVMINVKIRTDTRSILHKYIYLQY